MSAYFLFSAYPIGIRINAHDCRRISGFGRGRPGVRTVPKPDPNSLKEEAFHSRRNIL